MKNLLNAITGNTPFWVLTICSILLLLIGFFLPWPPDGTIDGGVIAGVGELIGLAAVWTVVIALNKGVDATVRHNNTEITVTNDKDER